MGFDIYFHVTVAQRLKVVEFFKRTKAQRGVWGRLRQREDG